MTRSTPDEEDFGGLWKFSAREWGSRPLTPLSGVVSRAESGAASSTVFGRNPQSKTLTRRDLSV